VATSGRAASKEVLQDSGFITNKTGCRVFLENIFSISLGETPLELVKSKQYDSFEAILADGWMVD
jgi:hypothetical protein